jgi:hypothetical protein
MSEETKQSVDSPESHLVPPQSEHSTAVANTLRITKFPLVPLNKCNDTFGRISTSLDVSSRRGQAIMFNLMQGGTFDAKEKLCQPLDMVAWLTADWQDVDEETGEMKEGLRYAIVCANGTSVTGVSDFVVSGLRMICAQYGPGPWAEPIRVIIEERRSKKDPKRRYNLLNMVVDEAPF